MKIRTGFVSNSSSSSFVITTTKKAYDRFLSTASEYEKAVLNALESDTAKLDGVDVVSFSCYSDCGGGGTFDSINENVDPEEYGIVTSEDENDNMEAYNIFERFQASLLDGESTSTSVDW